MWRVRANSGQCQAGKTRPLSARLLDLMASGIKSGGWGLVGLDFVVPVAPYVAVEPYVAQLLRRYKVFEIKRTRSCYCTGPRLS
ncbi:Uncharacterized protein TCM_041697 [Theobroma cacao]|uniref:Uncharacterized protein n=1 Tax=Theobroma cacao TaxID=3641 RepID=A0A061GXC7_THECC|nr:Uncharacterized protein TCM_041697 [Theobroma cacao]